MTFRRTIAAAAAAAILPGVAAASPAGMIAPSATVVASSHRAGARPVALTLKLRYEMQCGWPGVGLLTIRLPEAMLVPVSLPRAAVLLDGKPAQRLAHRGLRVVLGLPPRPQILCDSIAPGTLTVSFTRAARLGNPKVPGTYRLRIAKGTLEFQASMIVRRR